MEWSFWILHFQNAVSKFFIACLIFVRFDFVGFKSHPWDYSLKEFTNGCQLVFMTVLALQLLLYTMLHMPLIVVCILFFFKLILRKYFLQSLIMSWLFGSLLFIWL